MLRARPYFVVELHMFERLHATRKTGAEAFTLGGTPLGFTVFDFWRLVQLRFGEQRDARAYR